MIRDRMTILDFNNLAWNTDDLLTTGILSVVAILPGDYNEDGAVNAADYVVWRKTGGTQSGYDAWRANFGNTAGASSARHGGSSAGASPSLAAVPEPASATLIAMASLLLLNRRRLGCRDNK